MIDCLIMGDSIAVGTQRYMNECQIIGRKGINSQQYNREHTINFKAKSVIISLGSNDHKGVKTLQELKSLRDRIDPNAKVFWIVPAINPGIQDVVKQLAEQNKDVIINIRHLQPDGVHPTPNGYKDIVTQIKNGN